MAYLQISLFRAFVIFSITLSSLTSMSQSFNQFIERLSALPEAQRQAVVDSFLAVNPTAPHTESDTICNFYYVGSSQSVSIAGDFNFWNPTVNLMSNISGTTFWYLSMFFPSDTRIDYKIVKNGNNWILDPRNPNQSMGGYGPNSELRMPQYVRPLCVDYIPEIPHGTFKDTVFYSNYLGNSRNIKIYMPAGYSSGTLSYPVVYFHDGLEYVTLGKANNTMDYLIHNNIIGPVIGVFIPPVNREDEYAGVLQDEFTNFFINELIPWVDSRFRTLREPASRATIGASNGGNIALWLMVSQPETFSKVAAHSSNVENNIMTAFQTLSPAGKQVYIDIGRYDIEILIERVNALKLLLTDKDFDFVFLPVNDGHSWANWRDHLKDALTYLFPSTQGTNFQKYNGILNGIVKPNPVSGEVSIEINTQSSSNLSIQLFDARGMEIVTAWRCDLNSGSTSYTANLSEYKSGLYFIAYSNGAESGVQKLIKD